MGEAATSSQVRELIRRAVALHRDGRLGDAEARYRQALASDPANPDALNLLGVLIAQRGRPAEAVALIREAIAARPGVADYHCNLGHVERMRGEAAAAEAAYREALGCSSGGPSGGAAAPALGVMLTEAGRLDEAVEVYRDALRAEPELPDLWFNLSAALNQQGRLSEAEEALRRVIALRPDDVAAYANLAMLMLKCARVDAAVEASKRGLAVDPKSAQLHFGLGRALKRAGDFRAAAEAFRSALDCDPSLAGARSSLIRVLRLAGDLDDAVAAGRDAASADAPSLVDAELGLALAGLGRFEEALAAFERGVAKDPRQVTCHAEMGWLLRRLGREAEARRVLDFDRLAACEPVAGVPGYASVERFNRELAAYILARPDLVEDLPETATQGGGQTSTLFSDPAPLPQALKGVIERACRGYVERHRGAGGPAFFEAPPSRWFLNSNAVVLRSGGYQDAHMHPAGYVSGVYYVQVPEEVAGGGGEAGCLYFTDKERPAAEAQAHALRVIRPEAGLMLLFPSYFWHGVMPFEGARERICVAFDVIPASS